MLIANKKKMNQQIPSTVNLTEKIPSKGAIIRAEKDPFCFRQVCYSTNCINHRNRRKRKEQNQVEPKTEKKTLFISSDSLQDTHFNTQNTAIHTYAAVTSLRVCLPRSRHNNHRDTMMTCRVGGWRTKQSDWISKNYR